MQLGMLVDGKTVSLYWKGSCDIYFASLVRRKETSPAKERREKKRAHQYTV